MKKTIILIFIVLLFGCAPIKYRVSLVRPDGNIDIYFLIDKTGSGTGVWINKDGSLFMYGYGEQWHFEPGKYVSWSKKEQGAGE